MTRPSHPGGGWQPSVVPGPDAMLEAASGPPNAVEAEAVLLSAVLGNADLLDHAAAELSESDFFDPRNKLVFKACRSIRARGHPVDLITVTHALKQAGVFEQAGGATHLSNLTDHEVLDSHAPSHARIIQDTSRQRAIQRLTMEVAAKAGEGMADPLALLADLLQQVRDLTRKYEADGNVLLAGSGTVRELLAQQFSDESPLVEGFLYEGGFSFLVGAGGVGKTTASFALARALASGEPLFGLKTVRCRVGLLALETPGRYAQKKMAQLLRSHAGEDWIDRVFIRSPGFPAKCPSRWDMTDPVVRGRIVEWIEANELRVVIVDPFAHVHSSDENATKEMAEVTAAFAEIRDQTGAAIVMLHHVAKGERRGRQASRGSTVPYNYADAEVTLTAEKDGLIKAEWTKDPRYDARPKPFYLRMTEVGLLEEADAPTKTRSSANDLRPHVLAILAGPSAPMRHAGLRAVLEAQGLKAPKGTLSRQLKQLVTAGTVLQDPAGLYSLVPQQNAEQLRNGTR